MCVPMIMTRCCSKECLLNLLSHRPTRAATDRYRVNFADWRHFRGCAREKRFVGRKQIIKLQRFDFYFVAEIARDLQNRVPRYPEQN